MQDLFAFVPYLDVILSVLVAAHALALLVVNLTPTPTDNKIVEVLYRVVEYVAGIVHTDNVKGKGDADSAS